MARKLTLAIAALLLAMAGSTATADIIFRQGFESDLLGSFDFVVAWQDDRGGAEETQILARGMDGLFETMTVNTYDPGAQVKPVIGVADDGSFVVVWQEDGDGNGFFQVWARGFNPDGSERFPRITVNSEGAGQQLNPDLAMAPNGDFVVVWEDDADQNGFYNILGRGFNANGSARFTDRRMNARAAGQQFEPSIDMADDGSFVVAWTDDQDNNAIYQVAARGFNANGTERIPQFFANTVGNGQQWQPDVAVAPNGDFVIAWADDADQNFFFQVLARGFSANGSEKFSDITLNEVGTASQYQPAVGMAADGSFAAAWVDQGSRIASRVFLPDGEPFSSDVIVNGNGLDLQFRPTVSVNAEGDFVVIWDYLGQDGYYGLLGRRLDAAGNRGGEFALGNFSNSDQMAPSVEVR